MDGCLCVDFDFRYEIPSLKEKSEMKKGNIMFWKYDSPSF